MKKIKVKIVLEGNREINVDLFPQLAPISVENFVNLIKINFFDGLIFHRVIKNFMIQGGGMDLNLVEKGNLSPIKGEFLINGWNKNTSKLSHEPGVLSMARTNIFDSATSQFFIVTGDAKFLDGQYAAFGKVNDQESMKVILEIENVETETKNFFDDVPKKPIIIKTINLI
ncbi:peptidylprolyl isomerase [Spiroplasma taiwanense]|uniref:Peptidyl-prolyl cis-trans isomerase n=1 Tax=Spiroplasma taiwanense CT-1 TaxID=1276220 RepID=S5LYK6_9MOLU|nr:peptidylprolyl isomerase [Spiroplasma taiwanense]AGR40732.1 peptidyl-prolyl cis-trans isomerase [Spiroplasma taiwanense CT-1]